MVRNEPINLDGSTRDRAKAKAWQGALIFGIGAGISAITWFYLGFVWWGTDPTRPGRIVLDGDRVDHRVYGV